MEAQWWVTMTLILIAGGYLLQQGIAGWKRLRSRSCSGSCGCGVNLDRVQQPRLLHSTELVARLQQRRS